MGDSQIQLKKAKSLINKQAGEIIRESSIYITAAWGNTNQPDFLNQIIVINTTLSPNTLLETTLQIEDTMGRIRTIKNAPRIIDIDIIFYEKEIVNEENLQIPHPLMQERNFVLFPMNEMSPQFIHPVFKKTIHQLLSTCKDKLIVKKN